jgi:hypothetical protein
MEICAYAVAKVAKIIMVGVKRTNAKNSGSCFTSTRRRTSYWTRARNSYILKNVIFETLACVYLVSPHIISTVRLLRLFAEMQFV